MAELVVSQNDLVNSVTFLEQFLRTKLPQYDFSEGTAARDIAINSLAYVVAFFRQEVSNVRARQSLLKLSEISEEDSADEVVDEILSDWFIRRKTGRKSQGYLTLRFSRSNIGLLILTKEDKFTKGDLSFAVKDERVTVQSADLKANTDNLGVTYYTTTVLVEADGVGPEYDIDPGVFSDWPQISPYLASVENLTKFRGGSAKETSEALIGRSEAAITVRDLTVYNGIKTVLSDVFPQVLEVSPMGMGDKEMLRDLVTITQGSGSSVSFHRGSMIDAYIKFPVEFENSYAAAFPTSGGLTVVSGSVLGQTRTYIQLPAFPIYKIRSLIDRSVDPAVEVDFEIMTDAIETWNSSQQKIYLIVSSERLGQKLDLVYDQVTGYEEVQAFVENRRNRVAVANVLTKASFALYLRFELRYYPSATSKVDVAEAEAMLQDFVHSRFMGQDFRVSEIVEVFTKAYPGNVVQFPFVVVGELLLPNGKILPMVYQDRITPPEKYYFYPQDPSSLLPLFSGDAEPEGATTVILSDLQVSPKTMRYVVGTADIQLTEV